jgi:ABC-type lipoprotein release transport system permease subunit
MAPLLLGVSPFDAVTYAGVTVALVTISLIASFVPALRAVAVDPIECLRAD